MFVFGWVGEQNTILILHFPNMLDSHWKACLCILGGLKRYRK